MNKMVRRVLFAGALCFGMSACTSGGGDDGDGACGMLGAKIFGGETCDQEARSPVLLLAPIADENGELYVAGVCTATLVTVDDFVTSAHCFTAPARELGSRLKGFAVLAGGIEGEGIAVTRVAVHPSYNGQAGSPYDIAMGTLQRVPSPAIGPVPVILGTDTVAGDKVTSYGYGTNDQNQMGELKAANFEVDAIQGGNIIVSLEENDASICPGDSGGPLVKEVDDSVGLVGVNSFVTAGRDCAAVGAEFSGFVDIQNSTIVDFMTRYSPDITVK